MNHSKLWLVGAGLGLSLCTPAFADSSEQALTDARAIVVAVKYEATMDLMFANLIPMTESGFIGELSKSFSGIGLLKDIDAKYPGGRVAFGKRFGQIYANMFRSRYNQIIDEAAQLYAAEFSATELAEIRSFMESPVGRKMNDTTPKVQQSLSQIGRRLGEQAGQQAADQLLDEAEKYLGEIK